MKTRSRKILGGLGIVAGVALVAFEVTRFSSSGPIERWFWLLVGLLVTVFGGLELLSEGNGV